MSDNTDSHMTDGGETRRAVVAGAVLASAIAGTASAAAPVSGPPGSEPAPPAHVGDFDFFVGQWTVRHHRMVGRLVGSTTWQDFDGTCAMQKILGGQGNLDDGVLHIPSGTYQGATVRLFSPEQRTWSIFWIDSRTVTLDSPMVGGFSGKNGLFYGDDTLEGRPIKVRFLWTDIDPQHCQWEQAFWDEKTRTWETNWVMHHTRVA